MIFARKFITRTRPLLRISFYIDTRSSWSPRDSICIRYTIFATPTINSSKLSFFLLYTNANPRRRSTSATNSKRYARRNSLPNFSYPFSGEILIYVILEMENSTSPCLAPQSTINITSLRHDVIREGFAIIKFYEAYPNRTKNSGYECVKKSFVTWSFDIFHSRLQEAKTDQIYSIMLIKFD